MSAAAVEKIGKRRRKTMSWCVPSAAPAKPDDLNFTGREENGSINWWKVTPPKTDYWHAHQILGRAYAFELLDLINNPASSEVPEHILAYITDTQAREMQKDRGGEAIVRGFFEVISEYLTTGTADR